MCTDQTEKPGHPMASQQCLPSAQRTLYRLFVGRQRAQQRNNNNNPNTRRRVRIGVMRDADAKSGPPERAERRAEMRESRAPRALWHCAHRAYRTRAGFYGRHRITARAGGNGERALAAVLFGTRRALGSGLRSTGCGVRGCTVVRWLRMRSCEITAGPCMQAAVHSIASGWRML